MSTQTSPRSPDKVEDAVENLKIKTETSDEEQDTITLEEPKAPITPTKLELAESEDEMPRKRIPEKKPNKSRTPKTPHTPQFSHSSRAPKPDPSKEHEEVIGGEITVKMEAGKPLKLSRSSSQKVMANPVALFDKFPDMTDDACSVFEVIKDSIYANKHIGCVDDDGFECECDEDWDPSTRTNNACGDNCINRMMKVECTDNCKCGAGCQNQRFQQRKYANVSVIRTDKKGYGLRINTDLYADDFIFEYLGEVIPEASFRRRTRQYDENGIKHFYFMALNKGEFVDATKKGNLGRFCNHSCNPNCYVDKWNVGDKMRMGIFAKRTLKAGEELTFNYNVDRYGAEAQPCYCGEPNCVGFIGGKTQTGGTNQLSYATIEALGIDDGEDWDTAVSRKPRKKKTGEDDEEYVENVEPKPLAEEGVAKVMSALRLTTERWIAVKLLNRIEKAHDKRVLNYVVKMHGYPTLKNALSNFKDDLNVVRQVLDILYRFPRLTRNKIEKSHIEDTVKLFESCGDEKVETRAKDLLQEWSALETGYRIRRREADAAPERNRYDRREERGRRSRSRSPVREKSKSPPRGPSAPTGPRSNVPQRNNFMYNSNRPPPRPRIRTNLPSGWFSAATRDNRHYFYNLSGVTQWAVPTEPAIPPPPPPKPEPKDHTKTLDDIIARIESQVEQKAQQAKAAAASAKEVVKPDVSVKSKEEKSKDWRKLPLEKQKKVYENTIFPVVKKVVDRYKNKLGKDEIKRFFSEVSKKMVESDYKNGRVKDPTKLDDKLKAGIKKYVQTFFDKAVAKKVEHDQKKAAKGAKTLEQADQDTHEHKSETTQLLKKEDSEGEAGNDHSDSDVKQETNTPTSITPLENGENLKRKRESDDSQELETPTKRARSLTPPTHNIPPPPPAEVSQQGSPQSVNIHSPRDFQREEAINEDNSVTSPENIPPPPPSPPPVDDYAARSPSYESNSGKRKRGDDDDGQVEAELIASPSKRARSLTPPPTNAQPLSPSTNGVKIHSQPKGSYLGSAKDSLSNGMTALDAPDGEATVSNGTVELEEDHNGHNGMHPDGFKFMEMESN